MTRGHTRFEKLRKGGEPGGVRPLAALALVALVALAVPGCSEFRQAVGVEKTPPDEFQVRVRAPLSMPADYGLRAPQPGAPRPQETTRQQEARQIVLESEGGAVRRKPAPIPGVSTAEAALLARLGADTVAPGIRQAVDKETAALNESANSFVDSIMFWEEKPPPGKVVDPTLEAKRLQENAALGRRPDKGEIPIIERKRKGIFGENFLSDIF